MKTLLPFLTFAFAALFLTAAESGPDHAAVYQCPMHPWIKSDKADAKCTICGMALVAATAPKTRFETFYVRVDFRPAKSPAAGVSLRGTPAASVPLFKAHCSFLI